jgi:hypothetical protein
MVVQCCGIVRVYPTVQVVFSQIIPDLFTPGIVTSTRCAIMCLVQAQLIFHVVAIFHRMIFYFQLAVAS